MKPTLHQLHIFKIVAETLSYTKTANILRLTQPAVSLQVKQLESTTGLALIDKLGKKLFLTDAGKIIYNCALEVAQQIDNAKESIDLLQGIKRGHLDLAVATTASYFVIRMLADFAQEYPQIAVSLDVTNRSSLLDQLCQNSRDLVIMGEPPEGKGLDAQSFEDNPLVVVASPNHPISYQSNLTMSDLSQQTFVIREHGSGTRAAIERTFKKAKVKIKSTMEMTSNEAIKHAVQANLGLSIVSRHTVELEIETGRLVEIKLQGFPIMRKWYIVKRANKTLSPVATLFKTFVLEYKSTFK